MKNLKYKAAVVLLITLMCFSILSVLPAFGIPNPTWFYTSTSSGVTRISSDGVTKQTFSFTSGRSLEILGDKLYVNRYSGYISVYTIEGVFIRDIAIPTTNVPYFLTFVVLPDERIALLDNQNDKVYFIDSSGAFITNVNILDVPDARWQNLDGVVVNNALILSEDGYMHVLRIDLASYDKTIFKDLSGVDVWLGAITYSDGYYYVCGPSSIYRFSEESGATKVAEIPDFNIAGIVVVNDYAYVSINYGGDIYKVDLKSGISEVFTSGLSFPEDLEVYAPLPQGLTVTSTVDDPSLITEPWSYILTYPDGATESFTLDAGGGSTLLPITQSGQYSIAQTKKSNYNTSITLDGIEVPGTTVNNQISLTTGNLDADDTVSVVFSNKLVPDVAWAKPAGAGDSSQSSASTYTMPCRVAVPVQVSWDPDIEPNQELDIVKDRPIKIMVNLADLLTNSGPLGAPLAPGDSVTVTLTCSPAGFFIDPLEYVATRTGADIASNNVVIFNMNPPSTIGHYTITCTTTHGADTLSTILTNVKVRETAPLSLYYSHLYREDDYGTEPHGSPGDAYDLMLTKTSEFVKAVYPVPAVTVASNTDGIPGEMRQDQPAMYYGMLKDCQRIALEAKLGFWDTQGDSPYVIGVAIGPDLRSGGAYTNYFKYHGAFSGKKIAVGVSWGPAVKGVVVSDGYYSTAAHEIAHTFGLYYGVPEQYTQYNPGAPANGFWVEQNQWRSGYDFMGLSTYKSTTSTWTSTDTTFEPLFTGFKTTADPQIIFVNGIIWDDGTVEFPYEWYKLPYGIPHTVPTGDFAIRFTLRDESTVERSFAAQFFMNLDPGIEVGEDLPGDFTGFGTIPTDFAGFAFATEYPANTDPTQDIEVLDKTKPEGQQVIGTISGESVVTVSPGALSAGFGGFVPPVKEGASFKKGAAVPVKFQLKTPEGAFITTAQPTLYLSFQGTGPEIAAVSLPASTISNLFRYDFKKNQYVFNLDTRTLEKGTWQLIVYLGDGTEQTVNIRIR